MDAHKQLLKELLAQHAELRKILLEITGDSTHPAPTAVQLFDLLSLFKTKLIEHLALEDNVFYPEIFKILKARGVETEKTEVFAAQMKELAVFVFHYLDEYASAENISQDMDKFQKDTKEMAGKIMLRISVEEGGVYMYLM